MQFIAVQMESGHGGFARSRSALQPHRQSRAVRFLSEDLYHPFQTLTARWAPSSPRPSFPGLLAEQPKPVQAGSGLCPGFTISRAILSDAAALVRGDRFFTVDFSTANLSPWGYDLATLPQPGAYGGMMAKMLFANLPGQYHKSNSTFALVRPGPGLRPVVVIWLFGG